MATAVDISERGVVKQENSVLETYWDPFQKSTKNDIPLLVLHELAGHDNKVYDVDENVSIKSENLSDCDYEDSYDDLDDFGEDVKDPLFIHEDETFDDDVPGYGDIIKPPNDERNQKKDNPVINLSELTAKSQSGKKEALKRKRNGNFCAQNGRQPCKTVSNEQSKEKLVDLEPVRKSQRKIKKNVIFFDSYFTYTSDMFENSGPSLVKGQLPVNGSLATDKTTKNKAGTISEKLKKECYISEERGEKKEANVKAKTVAKTQVLDGKVEGKAYAKLKTVTRKIKKPVDKKKLKNNNCPNSVSGGKNSFVEHGNDKKIPEASLLKRKKKKIPQNLQSSSVSTDEPEIPVMQFAENTLKVDNESKSIIPKITGEANKAPRKLRLKTYFCEYCPESFSTSYYLKLHIMHHTNEKPYKCDICNKAFRMRWRVKVHRVIHEEIKPFACKVCGHRTCRKDNLTSHLKRVHNTPLEQIELFIDDVPVAKVEREERKLFSCNICPSKYTRRDNLVTHLRVKHNLSMSDADATTSDELPRKISGRVRPYSCTLCRRHFTNKKNGFAHLKLYHHLSPHEIESCLVYEEGSEKL
ncbi:zinc finger protein 91-like [Macrobrachium nipponense]|uniref:zinc finger protein 91-like n=1 Tax=Macrobrachium nipponense TaxID=159736 RepID=UPI0030C83D6C